MYQQHIRCNPSWYSHPCQDTVFIIEDENQPGMDGMLIAQLCLLFSFINADDGEVIPCALISWFVPTQENCDPETGMWTVEPEGTRACRPVQVIPLKVSLKGLLSFPNMVVGSFQLPFHM